MEKDWEEYMPTLVTRKLIKFGDGGLVINVPKAWARYYRLRAGDRLEVIADGDLVIRPHRKRRLLQQTKKSQ